MQKRDLTPLRNQELFDLLRRDISDELRAAIMSEVFQRYAETRARDLTTMPDEELIALIDLVECADYRNDLHIELARRRVMRDLLGMAERISRDVGVDIIEAIEFHLPGGTKTICLPVNS